MQTANARRKEARKARRLDPAVPWHIHQDRSRDAEWRMSNGVAYRLHVARKVTSPRFGCAWAVERMSGSVVESGFVTAADMVNAEYASFERQAMLAAERAARRFAADEPAYGIEIRWPRRGNPAPWCGRCGYGKRKARYVTHVGTMSTSALCEAHAREWKAAAEAAGKRTR